MRKTSKGTVYSATDIVNFLECEHITTLNLIDLVTPLERAEDDEQAKLVQEHGFKHEQAYLKQLQAERARVMVVAGSLGDRDNAVGDTLDAMRSGADVIYQAALAHGVFVGYADFLVRVERPSLLGPFSYEVEDTKLARSAKAKFLIQLCFYSSLLAKIQGVVPERTHVVLGDGIRVSYRVADYMSYFDTLQERFLTRIADRKVETYPQSCAKCGECQWSLLCQAKWEEDDHLNLVANIRNDQIRKLNDAGIRTLQALAQIPKGKAIPRLHSDTFEKLRHQAALQLRARQTGRRYFDLLPLAELRGFARMPEPNAGDLYFDMEGDPLQVDGLEYLFGIGTVTAAGLQFTPFWGHTREEEKHAFQAFMDFVSDHLRKHPAAHIYHYAAYEQTALKRLMSLHGTREREVDDLLRQSRLVDLYKVVSGGIRVSEPRYSLKNIEHFYMPPREGDVQDAGASIVFYERWRQTRDATLLEKIRAYNQDDVRSTQLLHQWLCKLRPKAVEWRSSNPAAGTSTNASTTGADEAEKELEHYRKGLLAGVPEDGTVLMPEQQMRVLTLQLLAFHRREQKPQWWAMFNRMELDEAELIEDKECLGGLTLDPKAPPKPDKQSIIYTYRYPDQETKLKDGDECTRADSGEGLGAIELDADKRRVRLRIGKKRELPERLDLGPGAPINDSKLRARMRDFAQSVLAGDRRFEALKNLLLKERPRVAGHTKGAPLVGDTQELIGPITEVVAGLKESYVFIQGPPGAGKTYNGSHVIAELLKRGKTVGVSSNSHKAINNLLAAVVDVAKKRKSRFRGFKKTSAGNADSHFESALFDNSDQMKDFDPKAHALFAGTAWAFAAFPSPAPLDYLFVDEAGQVSLANLVVMGLVAKNIVLLGDQMQLGQPIQGVHPGRSGESTLEYLLDGRATIPPDEGIFLPLTWRMHPAVCEFISQAVYDGRLHSAPGLEKQALLLNAGAHEALAPVGVHYLPVEHEGCSQKSVEEAKAIKSVYRSLLEQRYVDANGKKHNLAANDILVVSPYNMQVELLKATLPDGARVGTVDKFQGQEAQAVIISMATSSGDDLPRDIEFLFSKNRLNVAISRAKCLAIVVANPKLMCVKCSTPEQMALINTLCWARKWSLP